MPQGTTRATTGAKTRQRSEQQDAPQTIPAGTRAPRVGTADVSAPQPAAGESREMSASGPRRHESGGPAGPHAVHHTGTRTAQRVSAEDSVQAARTATGTRAGAAGRTTKPSTAAKKR